MNQPLPPELAAMADKVDSERASLAPPPVILASEYERLIPVLAEVAPLLGVPAPVAPVTEERTIDLQPDAWGIIQTLVVAAEAAGTRFELPEAPPGGKLDRSDVLYLVGQIQALLDDRKFVAQLRQPAVATKPTEPKPKPEPKPEPESDSDDGTDETDALFASRV